MSVAMPFTACSSALAGLAVAVLVAINAAPLPSVVPSVLPSVLPPLLPPLETVPEPPAASPVLPQAVIPVEVVRVIDGDTVEVKAHVWLDQMIVTRVRLRSIDAPEMRANCPEEARKAEASRDALVALLKGGRAYLTALGRDKYGGRVLGDLVTGDGRVVSQSLLATGHARAYAGGRRQGWC